MAVSIYHTILTLCRFLIINSYVAQATHCDTESCMFPYPILIVAVYLLMIHVLYTMQDKSCNNNVLHKII